MNIANFLRIAILKNIFYSLKKNPSEFLVEQRVKSNEQRAKSNEQRAKSNEQQVKSNEQRTTNKEFHLKSNVTRVSYLIYVRIASNLLNVV